MKDSQMTKDVDTQLKSIHDAFEKGSCGYDSWSLLYKESFLWNKLRVHSTYWIHYIYDRSVNFPEIHAILRIIRPTLEQPLTISAPPLIQESLYNLSKLALQIKLYERNEDRDNYIRMAASLKCFPPTLRYYIEAIDAHAKFADYLLYSGQPLKKLNKVLQVITNISNCPIGGVRHLEKFQKIDLHYTQPANKIALELIRSDEGQNVEFKSCFLLSKGERHYDKKKLDEQRLISIVAFLNSHGGNLFIGVDNNMSIHGIKDEIEEYNDGSEDKFVRQLTSLIRDRISMRTVDDNSSQAISKPQELISIALVSIDGHTVVWVKAKSSSDYHFFYKNNSRNEDYYVRTGKNKQKINQDDMKGYYLLRKSIL